MSDDPDFAKIIRIVKITLRVIKWIVLGVVALLVIAMGLGDRLTASSLLIAVAVVAAAAGVIALGFRHSDELDYVPLWQRLNDARIERRDRRRQRATEGDAYYQQMRYDAIARRHRKLHAKMTGRR